MRKQLGGLRLNRTPVAMTSLIPDADLATMLHYAATAPPGAFVEVGVYRGGSARELYRIAESQGRTLWLFDTFTGHPAPTEHDHPQHYAGRFADAVDPAALRRMLPNALVIVGRFPDSVMPRFADDSQFVGFAHVDVDLYESTRDAIYVLAPRMVPGGVMYFDDYGVPDCPGATKAVDEWFGDAIEVLENGKAVARIG